MYPQGQYPNNQKQWLSSLEFLWVCQERIFRFLKRFKKQHEINQRRDKFQKDWIEMFSYSIKGLITGSIWQITRVQLKTLSSCNFKNEVCKNRYLRQWILLYAANIFYKGTPKAEENLYYFTNISKFTLYFINYFELKAVHLQTVLNITMVGGHRMDSGKQVLLFS